MPHRRLSSHITWRINKSQNCSIAVRIKALAVEKLGVDSFLASSVFSGCRKAASSDTQVGTCYSL